LPDHFLGCAPSIEAVVHAPGETPPMKKQAHPLLQAPWRVQLPLQAAKFVLLRSCCAETIPVQRVPKISVIKATALTFLCMISFLSYFTGRSDLYRFYSRHIRVKLLPEPHLGQIIQHRVPLRDSLIRW
jgi:hypothetical protein